MDNPDLKNTEKLVRIKLADGSHIDFHRGDTGVNICRQNFCVLLPNAPGHTTMELFALLEPLGETITIDETEDQNGVERGN